MKPLKIPKFVNDKLYKLIDDLSAYDDIVDSFDRYLVRQTHSFNFGTLYRSGLTNHMKGRTHVTKGYS